MQLSKHMVEFVVDYCLENVGRVGHIKKWCGKSVNFSTPMCIIHTQAGHVPHLSHDLLPYAGVSTDEVVFQLTLPSLIHNLEAIEKYGGSLPTYVGLPGNASTILSIHDPAIQMTSGHNDKNSVSVSGAGGRYRVTVSILQKLVKDYGLNCMQVMADTDLLSDASEKRLTKALSRSAHFLESVVKEIDENQVSLLFGTVSGGFDEVFRCKSCSTLTEHDLGGYIFEGLHSYGNLGNFKVSSVSNMITKFSKRLPHSKLRICFGAFDPNQIFELSKLNVDVFDTSYALHLTESHKALQIDYEKFPESSNWFQLVDVADSGLAQDFAKLVDSCQCYTCSRFTKAYLYHLNQTSELLEYVLLMIHNLYQYTRYFDFLRNHMKSQAQQDQTEVSTKS